MVGRASWTDRSMIVLEHGGGPPRRAQALRCRRQRAAGIVISREAGGGEEHPYDCPECGKDYTVHARWSRW